MSSLAALGALTVAVSIGWTLPGRSQSTAHQTPRTPQAEVDTQPAALEVFSFADVDLDGRLELIVLHASGHASAIRDVGGGVLEDCTVELGLSELPLIARILLQDVDGDGAPELLVIARDGSGRLMRHQQGQGFRDITALSGLDLSGAIVDATWNDADGNGAPDLFLVTSAGARLYRNLGQLVFEESSEVRFRGLTGAPAGTLFTPALAEPTKGPPEGVVETGPVEGPTESRVGGSRTRASGASAASTPPSSAPSPSPVDAPPAAMPLTLSVPCANTVLDQATSSCIEASSLPMLGALYPITSDLFVEPVTGRVGLNTTSPSARLTIEPASPETGLAIEATVPGQALVRLTSVNTSSITPTLFVKAGSGGTSGFFTEDLSVGYVAFPNIPIAIATLGTDTAGNTYLEMGTTIELLSNEVPGNGAQLDLRDANARSRITLDAEVGSGAAEVSMFDTDDKETVQIRSESSVTGTGGQIALRRTDGPNAIVMEAATTAGAEISMRNAAGIETINMVSEEVAGNGAQIFLTNSAGSRTIVMDAEQGLSPQFSLYNNSGVETVEIIAEEAAGDGAQLVLRKFDGTASITLDASQGADGRITTETLQITGGADLVEAFEARGDCIPGSVLVIDASHPGALMLSSKAYDRRVAGIVSGAGNVRPGLELGQRGVLDGDTLVALSGRVYVRCTDENGPIEPGDMLTSSSTAGLAMRATDAERSFGTVIGKALTGVSSETGLALVLVGLQ